LLIFTHPNQSLKPGWDWSGFAGGLIGIHPYNFPERPQLLLALSKYGELKA
jgi:hypothetical protein